jgi:WD40 repeat protein
MTPRSGVRSTATADPLNVVMTLEGHRRDGGQSTGSLVRSISYFPGGEQMISGYEDGTVRRWDLQTGKEIVNARAVCKHEVRAVAVSRDSRWVITAGGKRLVGRPVTGPLNELKAWEIKTGVVRTFEGHSQAIACIDISVDSKLLASGSDDSTARIWNLDTGKLVAGPFECATGAGAARFSQDSKKLAVNSTIGNRLQVWDIHSQKLDRSVVAPRFGGRGTHTPVFWTTKDRTIVAAFSFKADINEHVKTIYEFDALTLDTVGTPFEGHTGTIIDLALSSNCALLASASDYDRTIKLWAFESRQLLASFDSNGIGIIVLSSDSRQLAYATHYPVSNCAIHVCDIPPDILTITHGPGAVLYVHPCNTSRILTLSHRPMHLLVTYSTYVIHFFTHLLLDDA